MASRVHFNIEEDKGPGLDGFTSGFLIAAWSIIGEEISQAALQFFQNDLLLKQLHRLIVPLLLCSQNPQLQHEWLCNVLKKMFSRFSLILPTWVKVRIEENWSNMIIDMNLNEFGHKFSTRLLNGLTYLTHLTKCVKFRSRLTIQKSVYLTRLVKQVKQVSSIFHLSFRLSFY